MAEGAEGVYHCISRCVRSAFLCGEDHYSGKSYEHRKEWIRSRLEELSQAFAVEVSAYAVMSNHLHVVLRTCPDWTAEWNDQEIARRWLAIFPRNDGSFNVNGGHENNSLKTLMQNKRRIKEIRIRLSSVSWFMRCINEYVARKANKEDGCKGRFWDGRFKCQALLDESANLACMMYVDLNPIRANVAQTPEESKFTSAFVRIKTMPANENETKDKSSQTQPSWLCPINDEYGQERQGILSLSLREYLDLLDWTGRQVREGKRGAIPDNLAPILERLKINTDNWLDTANGFGRKFKRAAGSFQAMTAAAKILGLQWLRGCRAGREAFSPV